jgi:ceramide glucosyltransferase
MRSALWLFQTLFILLPVCGCGYYLLCLWSARRFLRRPRTTPDPGFTPPVSILKPLKGMDPEIYASLRSHCVQEYPEYEIIFGVSEANDPAIASVEKLRREFPQHPIELVACPEILGGNVKVSNLIQMLPRARYEYLLVNDSDIRVETDYLRRVVAPLRDSKLGMVTCLYRGVAGGTLGSRLEALGISTDFCGGVLAAIQMEGGPHFGLGSTLVFRRADLQSVGGFEALVDYLADDYQLGQRLSEKGLEGFLSEVVVDTFLPAYSLRGFFDHQLRWARSVRDSRGWGYLGVALTFGLPWALLELVVGRGASWVWGVLGFTLALRMVMAWVVGVRVAKDWQVLRWFWLIPLRDVAALFIWAAGYLGTTVMWRGERFNLKQGKLAKITT